MNDEKLIDVCTAPIEELEKAVMGKDSNALTGILVDLLSGSSRLLSRVKDPKLREMILDKITRKAYAKECMRLGLADPKSYEILMSVNVPIQVKPERTPRQYGKSTEKLNKVLTFITPGHDNIPLQKDASVVEDVSKDEADRKIDEMIAFSPAGKSKKKQVYGKIKPKNHKGESSNE